MGDNKDKVKHVAFVWFAPLALGKKPVLCLQGLKVEMAPKIRIVTSLYIEVSIILDLIYVIILLHLPCYKDLEYVSIYLQFYQINVEKSVPQVFSARPTVSNLHSTLHFTD